MAQPSKNSRGNNDDTVFQHLTLEQILTIHHNQIERYGGTHGLRDVPLLESAVFRPQTTFGGVDLYPTIFDKAASLMHSLILNHPFIDGNKRTGVTSALVFLEINGWDMKVSQTMVVDAALNVASKKWGIEKLTEWFSSHSKNK